jgi:hypothetical protein
VALNVDVEELLDKNLIMSEEPPLMSKAKNQERRPTAVSIWACHLVASDSLREAESHCSRIGFRADVLCVLGASKVSQADTMTAADKWPAIKLKTV